MKLARGVASAWPGMAGLAALALAAVLVVLVTPRWQQEAEARLLVLSRTTAERAPIAVKPAPTSTAEVAASAWPSATASPRRAAALSALARRQGLELLQVREQQAFASHLQLAMNGRASYPALRGFVERALAQDPALVLDRMRLQRTEAEATVVEFELQWTLLHRSSPGRGPGPAGAADLRVDTRPRP